MLLAAALVEFGYAKDHTPASRAWYKSRLGVFISWVEAWYGFRFQGRLAVILDGSFGHSSP